MKALSIKQPWAWLIANGYKTIETRLWNTEFRGDLVIAASKGKMKKADEAVFLKEYPQAADDLEYGKAVAIVQVIDVQPMVKADEIAACCDIYDGAFSWHLDNVRKIQPFPVKGKLKLYDVQFPTVNDDERYYEFYERVAILMENNDGMTEQEAKEQARMELTLRKKIK